MYVVLLFSCRIFRFDSYFYLFVGGEYIKERILTILIVLIFFTSLGSAVASSDNDLSVLSDGSLDSDALSIDGSLDSGIFLDSSLDSVVLSDGSLDSEILSDSSDDLKGSSINDDLIVSNDDSIDSNDELMDSNDDSIGTCYSNVEDSIDSSIEISAMSGNSKDKASKNALGATDDSSIMSNAIVTKSLGSSSLSNPQIIIIKDASYYDGSINEYIQKLIDDAAAGSTIKFTGSSYENIYLRISKPLNIISKSGTIIKNIFDIPVFTILPGGSGTNISGFSANLTGSFVDASEVSKISISGNRISTKRNAIVFREVYDSNIKSNVFSSFKIAMDISNSGGIAISNNNITPIEGNNIGIKLKDISSKKGISILSNNIIGSDKRNIGTGIYFDRNASNVLIKANQIKRWYTAIEFPYSLNNVSIINNTISDNGDGVIINGWVNDFTFNKNLVTSNARVGVLFDDYFLGTKGNFTLENNYFSHNVAMDLQDKGDAAVAIGKNFAKKRCARVGMKYGFKIRSRQSGSKYYFSVVDKYGIAASGLPNFSATLTVNGQSYTVNFINSVAYLDIGSNGAGGDGSSGSLDIGGDNRGFGDWGQYDLVDQEEMSYYEGFYNELLEAIMGSVNSETNQSSNSSQTNHENSSGSSSDLNSSSNSGSSSGSGSGDSGVSSGSNSINSNGVLSGSAGSAGTARASVSSASSAGASPSQSSSVEESASAKTLSVDEETFRVIGVGGLVLLIILVIGLYYREDIKDMMEE